MMSCCFRYGLSMAFSAAALLLTAGAEAHPTFDVFPNFIGGGLGVTSDYSGSDDYFVGAVPAARYQFTDSERYLEWYGPAGDINLVDSATWQFGPALGLRFGRSNVDDVVVQRLPDIGMTVEGGLMASWTKTHAEGLPWRLRIGVTAMTDLGNEYDGVNASGFASFWLPLSPRVFIGLGGGISAASASYNQTYYGIDAAGAAASGLPAFTPAGGLRQWYVWPAVVVKLAPEWFLGTGFFYQHISGDPADSPLVAQRGSANQWTSGMGVGKSW